METKRAASSEWPPRSVKKSAPNGIAWLPKTRFAATRSAASVSFARVLLLARRVADGELGHLQRLAVDLAGGQPRQGLDDLEMARDHVGRELVAQIRPQRRPIEGDARLEHEEGDEAVHALVLAQHHGRLRDARQVRELRLDLAELDPEAADLDLVVDAAVEGDVARLVEADGVAGAVQDRVAAVGRERDWR